MNYEQIINWAVGGGIFWAVIIYLMINFGHNDNNFNNNNNRDFRSAISSRVVAI